MKVKEGTYRVLDLSFWEAGSTQVLPGAQVELILREPSILMAMGLSASVLVQSWMSGAMTVTFPFVFGSIREPQVQASRGEECSTKAIKTTRAIIARSASFSSPILIKCITGSAPTKTTMTAVI